MSLASLNKVDRKTNMTKHIEKHKSLELIANDKKDLRLQTLSGMNRQVSTTVCYIK
jgi:hypothetical protein